MSRQWLRACSLVVANDSNAIELAGPLNPNVLRIKFTVNYITKQTPGVLKARVYNLAPSTIQTIIGYATGQPPTATGIAVATAGTVTLKAGYQDNIGTIFFGYIYQLRVGKESNVDSYLDIFAADGDQAHNWAKMETTFAAGYTEQDVWTAAGKSMQPWQVSTGNPPDGLNTNRSPRGKVAFGMTRDILRDHAASNNYTWNILNQQLQGYPKYAVRPGEAVVINRYTGMIGVPEQTDQGISVVTLLNPALRWGTQIQLNDTDVAHYVINNPGSNPNDPAYAISADPAYKGGQSQVIPPINSDGTYVVVYCRHEGDTRGNPWYSHMVCISTKPSATVPKSFFTVAVPPGFQGQNQQ